MLQANEFLYIINVNSMGLLLKETFFTIFYFLISEMHIIFAYR